MWENNNVKRAMIIILLLVAVIFLIYSIYIYYKPIYDANQYQAWQPVNEHLYIGQGLTKLKDNKYLIKVATSKTPSVITKTKLDCNIVAVEYSGKITHGNYYVTIRVNNKLSNQDEINTSEAIVDLKRIPKVRKVIVQILWAGYQRSTIVESIILQ